MAQFTLLGLPSRRGADHHVALERSTKILAVALMAAAGVVAQQIPQTSGRKINNNPAAQATACSITTM